ncbi:MAG: TraB/GumN family protein [Bacteroidales bacterium]|nr:TraB/GumN family protein [Bacteroidales bacterium]
MKKIALVLVLVGLTNLLFSQSLLWKISGKNLKSPSYFYGTIHIQDQRVFAFDSTVLKAIASCDAFAMEILMDKLDPVQLKGAMYMPKGKVLSNMMSKEDFVLLDSVCKAKLGASAIFFNTMKPFFLSSALEQMEMPQDETEALDLFFLKTARSQEKSCFGLEEYMDQIKAIDAFKMKDQVDMLLQYVRDTVGQNAEEFDALLQAYLTFDFDKMLDLMSGTDYPKKFQKVLVDKRNITMANEFERIAQQQTLFAAVGAAHLAGEKGVLALLKKRGYTVEPVLFNWVSK